MNQDPCFYWVLGQTADGEWKVLAGPLMMSAADAAKKLDELAEPPHVWHKVRLVEVLVGVVKDVPGVVDLSG